LFPTDGRRTAVGWLALVALAVIGLTTLRHQVTYLEPPQVYEKDFKQDYLLARAVQEGASPYEPLDVLAARYLPDALPYSYSHSGGHPPFAAALLAPLGLVDYVTAARIWLLLELALVPVVVILVGLAHGRSFSPPTILFACGLFVLWFPTTAEMLYGQLTLPLAVLLLASWLCFKRGHPRLAGVLVGLATGLKLFPALVVGYYLVKQRWAVVGWACGTFVATLVVAAVVLGPATVRDYLGVGLGEAGHWRAVWGNYSPVGLVWWVTSGAVDFQTAVPFVVPVVRAPWLAGPISWFVEASVLGLAGLAVWRSDDPDAEYALAICATLLASPVTWQCYFVLLAWPLWVLGNRLHRRGWPARPTNLYLSVVALLCVPVALFAVAAAVLGRLLVGGDPTALVLPLPSVSTLALLPLVAGPALAFWMLLGELRFSVARRPMSDGHV